MDTLNDEAQRFYDWVSAPFVSKIETWKVFICILVFLIIAWFVVDNVNILSEVL